MALFRENYRYRDSNGIFNEREGVYVNFYGVVVEWDTPRKARKGTDYFCDLTLIDPLVSETNRSVPVRLFAPDVNQLPHVKNQGDIMRLHRVKVDHYSGVKLIASLGGIKKYGGPLSSFTIFHVNPPPNIDPNIPYQKSSETYHWDEHAQKLLELFRKFSIDRKWVKPPSSADPIGGKYIGQISSVFTDSNQRLNFRDIVAMVVAVQEVDTENRPDENRPDGTVAGSIEKKHPIVWIWDGTDAAPFPPRFDSRHLENNLPFPQEMSNTNRSYAEQEASNIQSVKRKEFDLKLINTPEALSSLPKMGSIIPVIFFGDHVEYPIPGSWIKFRNCGFHFIQGQLQGYMGIRGRWGPCQFDDNCEHIMFEYYRRERGNTTSTYAPGTQAENIWVSKTPHTKEKFTSLRQIQADWMDSRSSSTSDGDAGGRRRSRTSCAYRCLVRVTDIKPLRRHHRPSPSLPSSPQLDMNETNANEDINEHNNTTNTNKEKNENTEKEEASPPSPCPPPPMEQQPHSTANQDTMPLNLDYDNPSTIRQMFVQTKQLTPDVAEEEGYNLLNNPDEFIYAIQLRVEDGSASLNVDLFGRDAELFFSSTLQDSPSEIVHHEEKSRALGRIFKMLLRLITNNNLIDEGGEIDLRLDDPRGFWLELCVIGHQCEEGEKVRYRVFDTNLIL